MSKTDKEMRQELAKIRQEEENNHKLLEAHKLKESTRASSRAAAADKLAKEHMMTDPYSGREMTLWEYSRKKVDAIGQEVNSTLDWRSLMMGLWNIYGAMAHAMNQSQHESIIVPIENGITDYALLPAYDHIIEPLTNKITNLICSSDDPEITLPELRHEVTFTDDNSLEIADLTRSDNVANTGKIPGQAKAPLDQLFARGVYTWLNDNGYKPTPGDPSKFAKDGVALDKDTFNELKEDPEHGLGAFLKGYSELQFAPRGP
jgi:hypothetical protein